MGNEADKVLDYLLNQGESEFIEFKSNNYDAINVGQLISALANGAVLKKTNEAYLVIGVNNDLEVVGTTFDPESHKEKSQPIQNYLATNLSHANVLKYLITERDNKKVVIIVIPRAKVYPVKFKGVEYIRVGSSKKKLSEHPELARKLWEEILRTSFEEGYATDLLERDELFELLDFAPYFTLRGVPVPNNINTILKYMIESGVVIKKLGRYTVTNLGALLFARDMSKFESLINKGIRLIKYKGANKMVVERSVEGGKGYAVGVN